MTQVQNSDNRSWVFIVFADNKPSSTKKCKYNFKGTIRQTVPELVNYAHCKTSQRAHASEFELVGAVQGSIADHLSL